MQNKLSNELLQRYLDGEVTAAERAEVTACLAEDAEARARLDAGKEIGGLVRAYSAKALESAPLDGLLASIQTAIAREDAGVVDIGAAKKQGENGRAQLSARAARPVKARSGRMIASVILGGLAAAAAAGLFYVKSISRTRKTAAPIAGMAPDAAVAVGPAAAVDAVTSNQASIESLDVMGSASTIFTIPDDDSGDTTTVIWLSEDGDGDGTGG